MQSKYCLPIQKDTKKAVLETIAAHRATHNFFEVWVDYIKDLDLEFLDALVADLQNKLVIVFRHQNLEPIDMPLNRRLAILEFLGGTPAFVDLDVQSQKAELDHIASKHLAINTIISHHNYQQTPDKAELDTVAAQILARKPTILKVAAMCQTEQDALRLLQLLLELKAKNQRCIILGMGEHGITTRIFGTLWGNELIFAPETLAEQSAPGQLTRQQLDNITAILKG